jgi:hypothetical protein
MGPLGSGENAMGPLGSGENAMGPLGSGENAMGPQPGALQDVVELLIPSDAVKGAVKGAAMGAVELPVMASVPVPLLVRSDPSSSMAVMTGEIKFHMRAATAPSLEPCQQDADIIDEKPKLIT